MHICKHYRGKTCKYRFFFVLLYAKSKIIMKYLISGGGTGGHIFPAVSIANALKEADKEADILFVGALGRMEMERVPQAGYKIIGLPVRGFNRAQPWKNISVLWDLMRSLIRVRKIIRDFKPQVGVGVGGYASGAAMWMAAKMGIPILLQEQNGFAGVTNKLLKDKAAKICVAYPGMERFFPADKIILTGNPVRQNLTTGTRRKDGHPSLLIIGGSLGARTINEAMIAAISGQQSAIKRYISYGRPAKHITSDARLHGKRQAVRLTSRCMISCRICLTGTHRPTLLSHAPAPVPSARSAC